MSFGPCLCGDTHCPSCGPAQGNWRCPICRAWADDCCEHMADDGSGIRPEFQAHADEIARQEAEADAKLAQDYLDEERLAEEYWRNVKE